MRCSPIDSEQLLSKARIFDSLGGSEMWDWDLAAQLRFRVGGTAANCDTGNMCRMDKEVTPAMYQRPPSTSIPGIQPGIGPDIGFDMMVMYASHGMRESAI